MKITTAIEGFWLDKEMYFSKHTVKRYGYVFDRFVGFVGDVEIEELSSTDIKKYLRHLALDTNLSGRTIFDHHATLSSLWAWAVDELGIENIVKKVDRPKYTKKKIEPIAIPDVKKLIAACDYGAPWKSKPKIKSKRSTGKRDRAIILTLFDCGLRVTELCDLMLIDYEVSRGRIHIRHGKGDVERFVFAGQRCRKAIWRYLSTRPDAQPSEPLFCAANANALTRFTVSRMIRSAAKRAGIKPFGPHQLRHTFAIEFLRAGGNPFELKEILGHERLDMVLHYAQLAEADIETAARRSSPADKHNL